MEMRAIFGADLPELTELMASLGQSKYRAVQLADALYKQRVEKLEDVTTLSTELRERLTAEGYTVGLPQIAQTAPRPSFARRRERRRSSPAGSGAAIRTQSPGR